MALSLETDQIFKEGIEGEVTYRPSAVGSSPVAVDAIIVYESQSELAFSADLDDGILLRVQASSLTLDPTAEDRVTIDGTLWRVRHAEASPECADIWDIYCVR